MYICLLKKLFLNDKNWFFEIYFSIIRRKKVYFFGKHKPHLVAINICAVKIVVGDPVVLLQGK